MGLNLPIWTDTPETPITAETLNAMVDVIKKLWDNRSQVGDIVYHSRLDTMEKVIERFGGTKWEKIEGRFLLGTSETHTIGEIGGEDKHTLTIEEMPEHRHTYIGVNDGSNMIEARGQYFPKIYQDYAANWPGSAESIYTTGGNQPHSIMPPYKVVYIWERIE